MKTVIINKLKSDSLTNVEFLEEIYKLMHISLLLVPFLHIKNHFDDFYCVNESVNNWHWVYLYKNT